MIGNSLPAPFSLAAARGASIQSRAAALTAKWYAVFVVALWVFVPELRRIIDWQIGYNSISFINLVPLLSLIPPSLIWAWRRQRLVGGLALTVGMMCIVLAYGMFIAWASSGLIPGLYEGANFLFPMGFALWFASGDTNKFGVNFDRFCSGLLVVAGISAIYGLIQFANPPPWDVVWVLNSGLNSIGQPVPFGLRVFGTLNAPAPYADALEIAILFNIRFVKRLEIWRIALLFPILAAFALSLARSEWLALLLGLAIFGVLTPQRKQFLLAFALLAVSATVVVTHLDSIFGSNSGANQGLSERLSSFGELDQDISATARQELLATAWNDITQNPLGSGLGTTGTAGKLSAAQETAVVDNGYIARLLEFGYIGFVGYMIVVLAPLIRGTYAFFAGSMRLDADRKLLIATCLALQVSLIGIEISADHHAAFTGMMFWISVALVYRLADGGEVLSPPRRLATT